MFMHDSFSGAPFMGVFVATTLAGNDEEYRFSFTIDQFLPINFMVDQSLPINFVVDQQLPFNW